MSTTYLNRPTKRRIQAMRITAPQYRDGKNERYPVLSFIDTGGNHIHLPVLPATFLKAAGENVIGSPPEGFERLAQHKFVIHLDDLKDNPNIPHGKEQVVGIDVIPDKVWRSKVIPKSQEGVETLHIEWDEKAGITRVLQRPYNFRADRVADLLAELDKSYGGKPIDQGMMVAKGVRVESIGVNSAHFKFLGGARAGLPAFGDMG